MCSLSSLPVTAVTPVVHVFDPAFILSAQAIRTILHTVFSSENGFTPVKDFIIDVSANDTGMPLVFQVDWPPFPAQPDHPNPDLYSVAANLIAGEITSRIRSQTQLERFQVTLSNFEQSLGVYTSKPFVFEVTES